ncbi:MAG TPA: heme exporter protein CcmD [Gammaproteobacteria bacterium]|nr:heme exporter protein CcmD [Gammaproteobacteria bacterium]
MQEFLAMGGYAPFVWSSFGLTLLVLVANLVFAWRRHARVLREIRVRNAAEVSK